MSKSLCICTAGLVLGLALQGCGDSTSSTTPTSIVSSTNGASTTGPSTAGTATTETTTTVANTTTTTTEGPPPWPTWVPHSAITFAGRWYTQDSRKMANWGQSIMTQFSKSTQVSITMQGKAGSFFSYRVDDGEWTPVQIDGSMQTIQLASNLDPNSEHTVRFGKQNEPQTRAFFDFDHLELDEGFAAAQPPRKLVYQAIGDSITAGYKSECPALNSGGGSCQETPETENGYNSYVRHLAEAWGTDDWSAVAVSGVGVGVVMPRPILDYYKCREYIEWGDCQNPFDFSKEHQKPDVITINVGTNDYALTSSPPTNETFRSNYMELVKFVHETYPEATIFVISPLQWTICGALDGQPRNMWDDMHDNVKAVVDTIASPRVIYVPTGDPSNHSLVGGWDYSDNTHPTADGHVKFAELLAAATTPVIRRNHPTLLPPAEEAEAQLMMV